MKVLKFGGGCLKDAESIKKLPRILQNYDNNIIIVTSAFGKLTNLLQKIYSSEDKNFSEVISFFKNIMLNIGFEDKLTNKVLRESLNSLLLETSSKASILSIGELVSSKILSQYLQKRGIAHHFLNASKIIKTKNTGIAASVNWEDTIENIKFQKHKIPENNMLPILTQGFISGFGDGQTYLATCLGREGSDYSAAIFGSVLDADEIILFKDVDGIYSENPKDNPKAELFSKLSYDQAFQICNHRNTVVHPKTIQKLKEKKISLVIKNFNDLSKPGTIII